MPPGHLPEEVFWAHLSGMRARTRWRDYLSAGLGKPRDPPRGAGANGWGEECLSFSTETVVNISGQKQTNGQITEDVIEPCMLGSTENKDM